jgi:hypothetical protein
MEARLGENRERIIKLESEVEHMNEKLDEVLSSAKETKQGLDDLKVWQVKVSVVTGIALGVGGFLLAHAGKLLALISNTPVAP